MQGRTSGVTAESTVLALHQVPYSDGVTRLIVPRTPMHRKDTQYILIPTQEFHTTWGRRDRQLGLRIS